MKKINVACIIDDDPIFVRVVQKMMDVASFCNSVQMFGNGQEAINALLNMSEAEYPDIVFLDINMPVMDGWGFLEAFEGLGLPGSLQLFVVSSTINPAEIERARSYSFVADFYEKPITVKVLEDILARELQEMD